MNVIPIPTAQENNGLRNFMYVTESALKFLTAFGKFHSQTRHSKYWYYSSSCWSWVPIIAEH